MSKLEHQDDRITRAANVIRFLSEYIHGLNNGRKDESIDLILKNAETHFDLLTCPSEHDQEGMWIDVGNVFTVAGQGDAGMKQVQIMFKIKKRK